jgi:addiction module HigA family antidote
MSKSAIITELKRAGLPTHRRPTTPGEVIKAEFLEPLKITQTQLAEAMDIPLQRLNLIINGKRAVTPDTALRLSKALGCSIKFWLNLQQSVELYDAITGPASSTLERVSRVVEPDLAMAVA